MHGNGDVVAKGIVVQNVHGEEEGNIGQPANQRDCASFEEEGRSSGGEVFWPGEKSGDEKLDKGDEVP